VLKIFDYFQRTCKGNVHGYYPNIPSAPHTEGRKSEKKKGK